MGDEVAPSVPLPSVVTCYSSVPSWFQMPGIYSVAVVGLISLGTSPAPCPSSSSKDPRHTSATKVEDPSFSYWVHSLEHPRGTILHSPVPAFVWQLDPHPSTAPVNRLPHAKAGGAFQCSATAPSRFVIRQKAADCCNRYFSLKKLRSNLGEPFSMNTFTPERSLFSAST